ncbi:MAG: hypothetical protein FIA92_14235 [Chloroflexi bacterium]|nr:hypothetical protein [Chloroflexota bacterium]
MYDANAEVWLANQRIELGLREAARRSQLPPRPSWMERLRLGIGEALIAAGRRLLPTPRRTPVRAT